MVAPEQKIVEALQHVERESANYVALDLLTEQYEPSELVNLANQKGVGAKLGYLAAITLAAVQKRNIESNSLGLQYIVNALKVTEKTPWVYLSDSLAPWAKALIADFPKTETENKYHVHSRLRVEEMEEWIDQYASALR